MNRTHEKGSIVRVIFSIAVTQAEFVRKHGRFVGKLGNKSLLGRNCEHLGSRCQSCELLYECTQCRKKKKNNKIRL